MKRALHTFVSSALFGLSVEQTGLCSTEQETASQGMTPPGTSVERLAETVPPDIIAGKQGVWAQKPKYPQREHSFVP